MLAIQNSRTIINARFDRMVQKFDLKVAEYKYRPDAFIQPFTQLDTLGSQATGGGREYATLGGIASGVTVRIPTGGQVDVAWTNSVEGRRNGARSTSYATKLTLHFAQPLLKGAGIAVDTASIKIARLREEINILAFKTVIIDIVTSTVLAYRNLVQARQRLEISERSLQRTRELLAVNRLLIQAGRMAELDIVQTEADVASANSVSPRRAIAWTLPASS